MNLTKKNKNKFYKISGLILIFSLFCFVLNSCDNNILHYQDEVQVGKSNGQLIIDAIDAYHEDYGEYPIFLINLVPTYIEEIPKAPIGQYTYQILGNCEYTLSFNIFNHFGKKFGCSSWEDDSIGRYWECVYYVGHGD